MAILKLKEMQADLTMMERKVANYILSHLDEMNNVSIHTLAKAVGVSATTVLRLCAKLGFDGFSPFKVELMAEMLDERLEYIQEEINVNDTTDEVNKKILQMGKQELDDTYLMLDPKLVDRAVSLIDQSQRILILGVGSSALVAKEMEYQLLKIKKNVFCNLDYHIQYNTLSTFGPEDLLIVFSHSGETSECVNALQLADRLKVESIAITRLGASKVARSATMTLNTSSSEDKLRLIPIRSKVAQFFIIDALVTNLFIRNYDKYHSILQTHISNQKYFKGMI